MQQSPKLSNVGAIPIEHAILINNYMFNVLFEKILERVSSDVDFFKKRAKGAKKIEETAKENAGSALLTFYHFKAKSKPYKHCIDNIENLDDIKREANKRLFSLKSWDTMTEKEFQEIMGEFEVYGEVFLKQNKKR